MTIQLRDVVDGMIDDRYAEPEHQLLVHPDGGPCPDGCDASAQWCRCESIPGAYRDRSGWLVCFACKRAVH